MGYKRFSAFVAVLLLAVAGAAPAKARWDQDQGGQITPFYGTNGGPVDPFYGPINPFYGAINPFYGTISPFWGNIQPFWGPINPFYGTVNPFYGNIDPFWGTINPFNATTFLSGVYPYWGAAGPQWGNINTLWNQLQGSGATDYSQLQAQLNDFFNSASAFWGPAVQATTGNSFNVFTGALLAKYGIDPNSAASLAATTPEARSAFFFNFYDGLMGSTGLDHPDWWMAAVHWSPELAQVEGPGTTRVGLLDASTSRNNSDVRDFQFVGGYRGYVNDHGAAVASLIAAQQDGIGVMGVAPNSSVRLFNPFDDSGTANWSGVEKGIDKLYGLKATVTNASLGIPGWTLSQEWGQILTALDGKKHGFVLVKAAGNEGVTQTADIAWPSGFTAPGNLILVGSVGPTNEISQFSNTPGEACILVEGVCQEQNKLKYRFIVAPGELMLVEDNQGGVTRMTGTSFAAPLVSGAVALLQTRWPWLKNYSEETVQIILQSATDLGAPGVDPVYGWGMLNIEAAQSPLNFDNLIVFQPFIYKGKKISVDRNGPNWTAAALKAAIQAPGQLDQWQKQNAFLVVFENIGTTYRDFLIPLSSSLIGKSQTVNGVSHPFQAFLYQRLLNWAQQTPGRHRKHGSNFTRH
jgi:hypothetical protein